MTALDSQIDGWAGGQADRSRDR